MTRIKTETYKVRGDWRVDIQTTEEGYYAYIWNVNYGEKHLMFGMPTYQQSYEDFLDIVEDNFADYKAIYIEDVFDEEDK